MAVKASATITLSFMVDVKAVYRYYKLQASTASAPSVPTTATPSGWTVTEPTYTEGSTNTLYFVDKTVFTNDEFSYSSVSVSSSYEAAKVAYNKAVNANNTANDAKDAVDNMEIGGRNLFKWTGDMPITSTYNGPDGISKFNGYGTIEATDNGVKLTFDDTNPNTSISIPLVYDGCVDNGETITLSFDYRGNITNPGSLYFLQRTSPNVYISLNSIASLVVSEMDWQHYKATFSIANANERISYQVLLFYGVSQHTSDNWIEVKKGSLKLEKGNKATDWTPAPEDSDSKLGDLRDEVTSSIDNISENVSDIGSMVGGIQESQKDFLPTTLFEEYKTSIDTTTTEVNANFTADIEKLRDDLTAEVENRSALIRMAMENLGDTDEAGVEVGVSGSDLSSMFTNKRLVFLRNKVPIITMSADNEMLEIKSVEIKEELQLGGFQWSSRPNGNMGLAWIGGDE